MKSFKLTNYHHLFLVLGSLFGLLFVFYNPPFHANDEDRHFFNAYNLSAGKLGPVADSGRCGFILPASIINEVGKFQGIPFSDVMKLKPGLVEARREVELQPEVKYFHETPNAKLPPFAYIPAAIGIKIATIVAPHPIWLGWWGRIGCLAAYVLVIFFAIQKAPRFKALLMLVALSPMALYQGASVTYDSLSFALLFLFFAYLILYHDQEEKITMKQVLIIFTIALLHRFAKEGYYLLYFSLLFIPVSKFESKKVYFLIIPLMLVAAFLPPFLWNSYIGSLHLPPEPPFQNDYSFGLGKNIQFHMQEPIRMIKLIVMNVVVQGQYLLSGLFGRLGYSYKALPTWILISQFFVMLLAVASEQNTSPLSMRFRISVSFLALLNGAAIIALCFFAITPIGGFYMHGMQGRYFTPLLPFLLSMLFYMPQLSDKLKIKSVVFGIYVVLVLVASLQFMKTFYFSE